jgi:hypothetical protein
MPEIAYNKNVFGICRKKEVSRYARERWYGPAGFGAGEFL